MDDNEPKLLRKINLVVDDSNWKYSLKQLKDFKNEIRKTFSKTVRYFGFIYKDAGKPYASLLYFINSDKITDEEHEFFDFIASACDVSGRMFYDKFEKKLDEPSSFFYNERTYGLEPSEISLEEIKSWNINEDVCECLYSIDSDVINAQWLREGIDNLLQEIKYECDIKKEREERAQRK